MISQIIHGIALAIKTIFGMNRPKETTIINDRPLDTTDNDLLDDFGHRLRGDDEGS